MSHKLTQYHIYPYESRWALKIAGSEKIIKVFNTQFEAVERSVTTLRDSATPANRKQLFIHGTNGKIRAERYYPKNLDPRNIPG